MGSGVRCIEVRAVTQAIRLWKAARCTKCDDLLHKDWGVEMKHAHRTRHPVQIIMRDGEPSAVILEMQDYIEMLERLEDLEDLEVLNEMRQKGLEFRKLEDLLADKDAPSFASRWRGQFREAKRDSTRYDALAKKYLK